MRTIPRKYLVNYTKALAGVSEAAKESLAVALAGIDWDRPVAEVRDEIIAIMQQACGASTDVAARLAADFYDGMSALYGAPSEYTATVESMRDPGATDGAVRAFVQDLVEGKGPSSVIEKCVERIDYESRKAANMCTYANVQSDPRNPRWARVPTGAETCMFCIMLASRGFAYHSEETASHAHANCDCRIVPSWESGKVAIEGYDPDAYYDQWKESGFKATGGGSSIEVRRRSEANVMPDEEAHKLAQRLLRGTSKLDRDEVLRRIVEAGIEWDETKHSVDEDNYFNGRIRRLMVEHAISLREIDQWTQYYLK